MRNGRIVGMPDDETALAALDRAYTDLTVPASTLGGLLAGDRPRGWTTAGYLLKGSGRIPLPESDRITLGGSAERFPLLG